MHTKEFIRLKATHPKVVLDEYIGYFIILNLFFIKSNLT